MIVQIILNIFRSPGNATQPIWLDNVVCGIETQDCINSCQQCPSKSMHDCVHGEDLTVSCSECKIMTVM